MAEQDFLINVEIIQFNRSFLFDQSILAEKVNIKDFKSKNAFFWKNLF